MSKMLMLFDLHDIELLRNLYSRESSKTIHGFYTLNNFMRWFELNPLIDHVRVFVFNNWQESGFFVIEDRYQLFLNTIIPNEEDVVNALKFFDWSRNYKITALPASLLTMVDKTLRELSLNYMIATLKTYQRATEQIQNFGSSIPLPFDIRPLSTSDAYKINELWYSKQDGSMEFLKTLIQYNISMGIYQKDSNELIAWCTRCQCGFLGTLHVIEEYRGQGLAALLIEAIACKVEEAGEVARVMIHESNLPSQKLFVKLRFQFQENVFIIRLKSN